MYEYVYRLQIDWEVKKNLSQSQVYSAELCPTGIAVAIRLHDIFGVNLQPTQV
jgi:hypothetical protein